MTTRARLFELFSLNSDGRFVRLKSVRGAAAGDVAGCYRPDGYHVTRVDGILYRTHHLVWLWHTGSLPSGELDHIDGNPRNNTFDNLRDCNRSQNIANTKHRRNNTSGYKGVTWSNAANKWIAQIWKNNRRFHLGCFSKASEAFAAYCRASVELHGEFGKATSNPLPSGPQR